jgi:multiple sugar transport system ATP-binding protein
VFCACGDGRFVARVDARHTPERGERVSLRPLAGEAHLFDAASGARIGEAR